MSSTAVSIPLNVAKQSPTAAASPAGSQPAAADFVTLVQQMLGAPQAPPAASLPMASELLQQVVSSEDEAEEGKLNECAGLAALLALLPQASDAAAGAKSMGEVVLAGVADATARRSNAGGMIIDLATKSAAERLLGESTPAGAGGEVVEPDLASFAPTAPEGASASHRASQVEAALSRPVQAPVGSTAWSDEIATRLTLMTESGKQAASLRLSPEHLGPLEVRITVTDDKASVWFGAAHADTRAAIEQALPRLRELFEAQGMSLADAGVSHEAPRERAHDQASHASSDEQAHAEESVTIAKAQLGLVDAYA